MERKPAKIIATLLTLVMLLTLLPAIVFANEAEPPAAPPKTITLNPTGGTVSPATLTTGEDGTLTSLPVPLWPPAAQATNNRTCTGWFTAQTGGTRVTTDTVFTEDTVIFAQWRTAQEMVPVVPARNADGAIYYSFDEGFGGGIPVGRNFDSMPRNTLDSNPGFGASIVPGVKGNALRLDGTTGLYLGQGLINNTTTYTLAFWIKPDAPLAPSFAPIFYGARGGTNANFWISVHANSERDGFGTFGLDARSDAARPNNFTDAPLTGGEWQHVVISCNNGNVTFYVNGVPQSKLRSNTVTNILNNATSKFYLGVTHAPQDAPLKMEIDELYIYNRALSPLDVAKLLDPDFELPTAPAVSPVVPEKTPDGAYYWSFDEDFGGAASVQVGAGLRGVDLTTVGTAEIDPNGHKGGAVSFDYFGGLYLGDDLITSDRYTIAFWTSPKSSTDMTSMFYAGDASQYLNFTSRLSTGAGVRARIGTLNRDIAVTGTTRGWIHYALVVNGTTAQIWVNGFLNATINNFHNNMFLNINGAKYFLGVNFANEAYMGLIDELYIYDGKALARADIMELADLYAADRGQYVTPGANAGYADPPAPVFRNVSVHDPSIRKDGNGYYIVGTHLASARSNDLINWTQVYSDGINTSKTIYPRTGPNSITSIEAQIARVRVGSGVGMWALDVIQLPDGRYYQYYSLAGEGAVLNPSSAIGVAVSDNIGGPFETIDIIVACGPANSNKAMYGGADYNANGLHPNCIDPALFFDTEGELWMVYGSWSGGIFLMEMDKETGLAVPYTSSAINRENDGYGRKLIASYHQGMEGPYVIYSPETEYYYLFITFGGLEWNDGYNMRVFRSRKPDGPYEDDRHTQLNVWDGTPDAGSAGYIDTDGKTFYHNDRGVKIMGSHQYIGTDFERTLQGHSHMAPGHNSAFYDEETGQYFLVYHQRGLNSNAHQVRITELFLTGDGWLAAAPFRYDGGTVRSFDVSELVGSYKVLYHGRDTNKAAHLATTAYNLVADGSIVNVTGLTAGSWKLSGDNTAEITINGVTYKGVFLREWNSDQNVWSQTFTAISEDGMAIWGVGISGAKAAPVYSGLLELIATAGDIVAEGPEPFTTASWEALLEALDLAKGLLPGIWPAQADIDDALVTLVEAVDGLAPRTVVEAIPTAWVKVISGNMNELFITINESFCNGTANTITVAFMIRNNAAGFYTVGPYNVYVDTKGNDQIRNIYIG